MYLLESILLGILQGIAEWLPISSTGHLRLAEHFLGLNLPLLFDLSLHIGTLIPVLFFFRRDVKDIISALARLDFKSENGQLIVPLAIGTVATGIIGLVFVDVVESLSHNILSIAIALLIGGTLLYASKAGREKTDRVSIWNALIFGLAQGAAILPGLTRSGTTIAVALLVGTKREKAFKFSFLLSIPTIIAAQGLTLYKQRDTLALTGFGATEVIIGATIAMIIGYLAVRLVRKIIMEKKFHWFALYCWLLGAAVVLLYLRGF
ncbi:undecaprenyl-diphosphate phosphatase [Candidatus Bathyarchaeota archaeon]|nr:undecaprenyl-diphosphate phosphatase [Candidatus Bathyarchaeota archaeon]